MNFYTVHALTYPLRKQNPASTSEAPSGSLLVTYCATPTTALTFTSTDFWPVLCTLYKEFMQSVLFCVLLLLANIVLVKFIYVVRIIVDQRFSTLFISWHT